MLKVKEILVFILIGVFVGSTYTVLFLDDGTEQDVDDDITVAQDVDQFEHLNNHTHEPPEITVTDVTDDGQNISISGTVSHAHLEEIFVEINWTSIGAHLERLQPNENGSWFVLHHSNFTDEAFILVSALHPEEASYSEVVEISINRSIEEETPGDNEFGENESGTDNTNGNETDNGTDNSTGNSTDNNTSNNAGNQTNNGSDNSTGNQTDNGSEDPTGPTQPTYDPSDMGQFWIDVFRCQAGQNITPVDDLTTTAVETHECSVSISMNQTHITITANGLPDHDFESTLACSEANDCTRAQNYEWNIPRSPINDTSGGHDATNCPEANGDYECAPALGDVAIAINGVPFYGPEDGPGGDAVASHHGVYNEDRQNIELGVCHAHSGMGGTYHYHADANCLHWHPEEGETILDYNISTPAAVAENTANGSHSSVIGVAMDGYPIYGLWGYDDQMNIVEMKSSYKLKEGETGYNGIDDYVFVQGLGHLDVCNGHFGPTPEFPEGIYHYHSTMMNGEGDIGFPYFLLCYHGETFLDEDGGGADCSGHGETWGPGIGPPPPGCEQNGGPPPGGQLFDVSIVESDVIHLGYLIILTGCIVLGYWMSGSRRKS